jgi:hypothetical protein
VQKRAGVKNACFSQKKKFKWPKNTSLAIEEMHIKTTLRFYLTPVRIAIISNTTNNRCWQERGEKGTLLHCWVGM